MANFYVPILEIVVAFAALYFLPEGIIRIYQRFFNYTEGTLSKFFLENLRGYFFGTSIALSCFFAFGISPEDFFANSIRSTANFARSSVGMDAMAICVRRAKEQFRYDPDTFSQEASSFNVLAFSTLTPRQSLLAEGQIILLTGSHNSLEDILEDSYRNYCRSRL